MCYTVEKEMAMKKNKGLVILNIILVLALISLGGYILWDKSNQKKEEKEVTKETTVKKEEKKVIDKIEETRDWVYDASYPYTVSTSHFTLDGKRFHVTDIKVPYINIKSVEIEKINKQIQDIFNQAIAIFEQASKGLPVIIDKCDYSTYIHDNLLSIFFLYSAGDTNSPTIKYYTYNIDLKTGKLLSYNKVREMFNYTSDDTVKSKIKTYIEDEFPMDSNKESIEATLQNYTTSMNDGSLPFYIDANQNLNIITKVVTASSTSGQKEIITIQK